MKEAELRKICKCSFCGEGILHTGLPLFYTLKIARYGVKMSAVKRQAGLEMMMGGHVGLAQVMGPDEDMAENIMKEITLTACESCSNEKELCYLISVAHDKEEAESNSS